MPGSTNVEDAGATSVPGVPEEPWRVWVRPGVLATGSAALPEETGVVIEAGREPATAPGDGLPSVFGDDVTI